jgi:hypothetical protein
MNLQQIAKEEVKMALTNGAWDLGNQVLYDLCFSHPFHKDNGEIIAKIWLIGRSYSAALERRKNKNADSAGDLFYEKIAAPKIKSSEIDTWLGSLNELPAPRPAGVKQQPASLFCARRVRQTGGLPWRHATRNRN